MAKVCLLSNFYKSRRQSRNIKVTATKYKSGDTYDYIGRADMKYYQIFDFFFNFRKMVVCAELSTECNNKQSTNSGYFKLSHFDREVLARDANNNGNSTTNNNNNNQNANTNSTYSTSNSLFDASRDSIKSFYQNSVILVTGGTGFLGKVLLEKLLRSCEDIQCIYVLLRSKRGLSSEERYKELIQNPVFSFIDF